MSKSKRSNDADREKAAEKESHKLRRQQRQLEAELAKKAFANDDLDTLYDDDIPTFQKLKRVR